MLPLPSITHCQRNVFRLLFTGKPHESESVCLDEEDGFFICDVDGGGSSSRRISPSLSPGSRCQKNLLFFAPTPSSSFLFGGPRATEPSGVSPSSSFAFPGETWKGKRGRELLLLFYFSILAWVLLGERKIFSHKRRLVLFF